VTVDDLIGGAGLEGYTGVAAVVVVPVASGDLKVLKNYRKKYL
jgi:hypothetical protein